MKLSINIGTILFLLLILLYYNVNAQENSQESFNSYEKICYCTAAGSTPQAILSLDNNFEILRSLLESKTFKQLDSMRITYTQSQLRLLKEWGLISKSDDKYLINFPLLDKNETGMLRSYSKIVAEKVVNLIKNDVSELNDLLRRTNRQKNSFTILFSYILDGLVWDELESNKIIEGRMLTVENPFWSGEFWLLSSKRQFYCGTNSISDSGYSIIVNWSDLLIPKMIPFVTRWDLLGFILSDLIEHQKILNKEAKSVFAPYNFFDSEGNFTIPFIEENTGNELFVIAKKISRRISSSLPSAINFDYLKNIYNFKSNEQAIIILYHEVMWDVLDQLDQKQLIEKPNAFTNPDEVKPEDIADLILIIKK